MRLGYGIPIVLLAALTACQDSITTSVDEVVLESDFARGADGWVVGFADYPVGEERTFNFESGIRNLPAPLDTRRRAMYVSGSNRSDDLFMYLKRPVEGLTPGATYLARFEVEIATNEGSGCIGIGGAPGEAVVVKAGVSRQEPARVRDAAGWYRLNIDKGNQVESGQDAVVLGNISNGSNQCSKGDYRLKRLSAPSGPLRATADAGGNLWLLVGTDSGYEGITNLYYTEIRAILQRQ